MDELVFSTSVIRDWAFKLIASEIELDSPTAQTNPAAIRVYEKLRKRLCAPIGIGSFRALASRALSLAKFQSPELSALQMTANGSLHGFDGLQVKLKTTEDGEVGVTLITQLLGLCLNLLGEATTICLLADVGLEVKEKTERETTVSSASTTCMSYFAPFENILLEADQLRKVSQRLEILAGKYNGIEQLVSLAGNIRNIATVLDVFTVIKNNDHDSSSEDLSLLTEGYVN